MRYAECVGYCLCLMADIWCLPSLQFEMECRPFYVSGFNAHDLVPKSLATPQDHKTVGQPRMPIFFPLSKVRFTAGRAAMQLVTSLLDCMLQIAFVPMLCILMLNAAMTVCARYAEYGDDLFCLAILQTAKWAWSSFARCLPTPQSGS